MVKHDSVLRMAIWFSRIASVCIGLIGLYGVWITVSTWSFLDLTVKVVSIVCILGALGVGFFGEKFFLGDNAWKQWKHVEALRGNPAGASLYHLQPEADEMKRSIPVVVSSHLAPVVYLIFAVFWLALLGGLYSMNAMMDRESLVIFSIIWVIAGAIVIGLPGVLVYERAEATVQGLVVHSGFKRCMIPWDQAKLFAAVGLTDPDSTSICYELSSPRALLRWGAKYPGRGFIAIPRQRQEYEHHLKELLSYIHTQTGLPLLDLR